MIIAQTLDVDAPVGTVWTVITDLPRYPEWNPFVVACTSTLVPSSPITMRVRLVPFITQPQRERVFEHVPGRRLSYGVAPLPLGTLASTRSHEVSATTPERTRYVSRFELTGWLAPLVEALLGRQLRRGFAAMSTALQARAETLHAARR